MEPSCIAWLKIIFVNNSDNRGKKTLNCFQTFIFYLKNPQGSEREHSCVLLELQKKIVNFNVEMTPAGSLSVGFWGTSDWLRDQRTTTKSFRLTDQSLSGSSVFMYLTRKLTVYVYRTTVQQSRWRSLIAPAIVDPFVLFLHNSASPTLLTNEIDYETELFSLTDAIYYPFRVWVHLTCIGARENSSCALNLFFTNSPFITWGISGVSQRIKSKLMSKWVKPNR